MSTVTDTATRVAGDTVMAFEVGPHGLDAFLKAVKAYPGRLTYREGRLTFVSPSVPHERENDRIDEVIKAICDEFEIDASATVSTLFVRPDLDRGIEPDRSYYIAHQGAVDQNTDEYVDLRRYPPPDLVVEVVWSHPDPAKLEILAAMGVPEVWRHLVRKGELQFLVLDESGVYTSRPASFAFPFVTPGDVLGQLRSGPPGEPTYRLRRRLRAWARDELGPRRAGG